MPKVDPVMAELLAYDARKESQFHFNTDDSLKTEVSWLMMLGILTYISDLCTGVSWNLVKTPEVGSLWRVPDPHPLIKYLFVHRINDVGTHVHYYELHHNGDLIRRAIHINHFIQNFKEI